MRLFKIILFFSCFHGFAAAQVLSDSFSDGDFTTNPTWSGDAAEFTVSVGQLRLNATIAGASYLSTPTTVANLDSTEWNFYIRQNFAPSGANYGRVYLVSDQANLENPLNGYYLQFGEAGSLDAVELFRQTGTTPTSVCRATNSAIAASFAIRVKVTRSAGGLWKLYADYAGGTNYVLETSGTDVTYTSSAFFGVACVYTVSNVQNFYFDDFYEGFIQVDNIVPVIDSVNVISQNQLDVVFSETVDLTTSQTATNYSVNNGIGNPSSAVRDATSFNKVHLTFGTNFTDGQWNIVTTQNIQDLVLNVMTTATDSFVYYIPKYFDVLVNEIMADPDPPMSLPNYEYVELYNTTGYDLNLKNWTITIGSNTKTIPAVNLPADSFLILTSTTGAPNFTGIISTGVTSFPSVTNTGNTITVRDSLSQIIHSVAYDDSWYQDAAKEDGGWSLEMIDPNNPCAGITNWKAAADLQGGTPGKRNSVFASNPDNTPPQILRVGVIAPYDTVLVFFNEPADSLTLLNTATYSIDNGVGNPIAVDAIAPDFSSVKLTLAAPILSNIIYTITVNNVVTDCAGNVLGSPNTARFAIPEPCLPNDLVINEIMPDPKDNGVEWVEIYNRSNKVIDLSTLTLCSQDTILGTLTSVSTISSVPFLIFPGEYYVLSANQAAIKNQYTTTNVKGFIDMSSIPSLSNTGDIVVIADLSQTIIDKLVYYDTWHFPLLNSTKGFSLERIDYDRPTQDQTNWHTCAEDPEATPAYKNSQYSEGENGSEITLSPEIFSPDNDGYNDVLNISYQFETAGMIANITIYDSKGRLVRTLVRNELLGTSGTFSWDGITDDKQKARIGIYIIYFEAFDANGNMKKYKLPVTLAGKF